MLKTLLNLKLKNLVIAQLLISEGALGHAARKACTSLPAPAVRLSTGPGWRRGVLLALGPLPGHYGTTSDAGVSAPVTSPCAHPQEPQSRGCDCPTHSIPSEEKGSRWGGEGGLQGGSTARLLLMTAASLTHSSRLTCSRECNGLSKLLRGSGSPRTPGYS